ncbi:MAG TPA: AAA family ATPase [Jatrophihabitantaceae bacterium]|nr:AAA family ATPase [Jatrophihabitantaceae bacterium]
MRGRDAELDALLARLARLRSGSGCVVVVDGPPGLGKTRLLREAWAAAITLGIRGGHGMADPLDRVVELAPILEALFDHDPPLFDRSELSRDHAAPEHRFWLLQDIEALLERAAMSEPLVMCLDDLQWADNGTAAALRTLPRRLAGLPIMWLLSTRSAGSSPHIAATVADLVSNGALRLSLAALDRPAVEHIVRDLLGATPDDSLLRLAQRTEGNPFLLVELIRGLAEENIVEVRDDRAVLVSDRMPTRVGGDMHKRLARLPEASSHVAVAASSLGRRFTVADLATLSGLPIADLARVVQQLIDAGIFTEYDNRLAFQHDLVRDAVRGSVPLTIRRELDRRGVDVLLARGALPVEVATQLAHSADPGDEIAIATLAAAAEDLGTTDPVASAEIADSALKLTALDHPLHGPLVARRAVSLFAAGQGEEAKQFAETSLRQSLTSEHEAQVRLSIASMFVLSPDVRADNARAALDLDGVPADIRAWLQALVLHNLVVAGRTADATAVAPSVRSAVDQDTRREARFALLLAESGLSYQLLDFARALSHLDAATHRGTSEDVRARLEHYFRCWVLEALDRFDDARAIANAGISASQRDHQGWALRIFEAGRGIRELQAGRLPDAATALEGQFEPANAQSVVGIIDAATVGALGRLKLHQGDEHELRRVEQISEVMLTASAPSVRKHAAWFLASRAMAMGDPSQAHARLCALGVDRRLTLFPLFPHDVALDADLVKIALANGDEDLVASVTATVDRRADLNPGVLSVQAAAAHVRGLLKSSSAEIADAASLYDRAGRPLGRLSALEDLATQLLHEHNTHAAIEQYDRALVLAADIGASWDASRIRSRLRDLGIRRRLVQSDSPRIGWEALTRAESAVVDLVVDGRTNREIAEKLFISPHTVSTHLRHVFDKLGIRSRVELTRAATERASHRAI